MSEHDGIPRARAQRALTALSGERLGVVVEGLRLLASMSVEDARVAVVILRRIAAGADKHTRALHAAHPSGVECHTAIEYLDARISSVLACIRKGGIRGLKLPPEAR